MNEVPSSPEITTSAPREISHLSEWKIGLILATEAIKPWLPRFRNPLDVARMPLALGAGALSLGSATSAFAQVENQDNPSLELALANLGLSLDNTGPTETVELIPSHTAIYDFEEGVSDEDRSYIQEAVRIADNFFLKRLGTSMKREVLFDITISNPLGSPSIGGGGRRAYNTATNRSRDAFIVASNPAWIEASPTQKKFWVIHEYSHILQSHLLNTSLLNPRPTPEKIGAFWMMEGGADFLAYMALAEEELLTQDQVRTCFFYDVPGQPTYPLQDVEPFSGSTLPTDPQGLYRTGRFAVDILTSRAGMESLRNFLEQAAWDDWRSAFANSFGMDVNSFYQLFEEQRSTLRATPGASNCKL